MKERSLKERSFGLSVGGVLCAIAAYQLWRGRMGVAEIIGAIGALLVLLGWLAPSMLARPAAWWWRLAQVLAYVNTRILLTVLFFVLLVPLSVAWRLVGRDPLARRRGRWAGWSPYPARYRDRAHYQRTF